MFQNVAYALSKATV